MFGKVVQCISTFLLIITKQDLVICMMYILGLHCLKHLK